MTNEEAIAYGKRVIDLGLNDETQAFCELAIKALETIPKYKDAYGKGWDDGAKATYEHLKMCEEEQEPIYCDRNICIKNEYSGISCDECEVTKSQEKSGDLMSRDAVLDIIHRFFTEEVYKIPTEKTEDGDVLTMGKIQPFLTMNKTLSRRIKESPGVTAEPKTGHCKDCKYFEYDSVAKVDGIPLIVAHEICKRWGDGCKTKEDGYCFMFEPKAD